MLNLRVTKEAPVDNASSTSSLIGDRTELIRSLSKELSENWQIVR